MKPTIIKELSVTKVFVESQAIRFSVASIDALEDVKKHACYDFEKILDDLRNYGKQDEQQS